jgi:hypothetical protein
MDISEAVPEGLQTAAIVYETVIGCRCAIEREIRRVTVSIAGFLTHLFRGCLRRRGEAGSWLALGKTRKNVARRLRPYRFGTGLGCHPHLLQQFSHG